MILLYYFYLDLQEFANIFTNNIKEKKGFDANKRHILNIMVVEVTYYVFVFIIYLQWKLFYKKIVLMFL